MIRNIVQSHAEREIIKTAPDMVVYVENMPYVFNKWVSDDNGLPLSVNINEFVTNISISVGVEMMIPSCTITLGVPNHLRYMFMAPGGNRILNSMDEIQVFCKGYFLSKEGRSVYHRVFHGIISSISYTETTGSMEVSLTCDGILKLLEIMLISDAPAVGNNSGALATAYMDQFGAQSPYATIASVFKMALDTRGILSVANIAQAGTQSVPEYVRSLENGQVARWAPKLKKMARQVRLYGYQFNNPQPPMAVASAPAKTKDPATKGAKVAQAEPIKPVSAGNILYDKIQSYLPSMGVGALSLTNSRVMNRLEKLRNMVDGIMFEAYQDLSGEIIIKPPFYNLDVTKIHEEDQDGNQVILDEDLFEENNPFIIYASEVESEHEVEDQTQIRYTRMTVQGSWSPGMQMSGGEWARGVGVWCDVGLASRFGLRDSGVKQIGFVPSCSKALFAMAVSELVKANRSFRSYTCTIPIRPELKLGFPVYLTHHDMYAYPRAVTISYSRGGTANMSLNCDTLRKRPMRAKKVMVTQDIPSPGGGPSVKIPMPQWVYQSQPNLVYKWVRLGSATPATWDGDTSPDTSQVIGVWASQPTGTKAPEEFLRLESLLKDRLGSLTESMPDREDACWVIQDGTDDAFNPKSHHPSLKKIGNVLVANEAYVDLIRTCQPYTDEKGYELVSPFPWGRGIALDRAMEDVAQSGYLYPPPKSNVWTRVSDASTAFVFSGMGGMSPGLTGSLLSVMEDIGNLNPNSLHGEWGDSQEADPYIRSFELEYSSPEEVKPDDPMSLVPQFPDPTPPQTPPGKPQEAKPSGIMAMAGAFVDGIKALAATPGETGPDAHSRRFRGRLGALGNDIKFHPNTPSLGGSILADQWAGKTQDWLSSAGSNLFNRIS